MDGRPRSVDTGLISDLMCIVGSRSDGQKGRGEDLTGELGFQRAIAGEGVQVVCSGDVSGAPEAGGRLDGVQNVEKNLTA
jgi:hypothetical protein